MSHDLRNFMYELQKASSQQIDMLNESGYGQESRREIGILESVLNFTGSYANGFGLPIDPNVKLEMQEQRVHLFDDDAELKSDLINLKREIKQ